MIDKIKIIVLIVLLLVLCGCGKDEVENNITIDNNIVNNDEVIEDKNDYLIESIPLHQKIENIKIATDNEINTMVDEMETILFGKYYKNDAENKDDIEWVVVDRVDNQALLLSKYIIDNVSYNVETSEATWENSNLRKWLNDDFYNIAFSDEEKNKIVEVKLLNEFNTTWNINGGNSTKDKIFCLSIDEIEKYYKQDNMYTYNKRLATYATDYAKDVLNDGTKLWKKQKSNTWYDEYSSYYLRTPGSRYNYVASINHYGYLNKFGVDKISKNIGIRPAMWIKY